MLKEWKGLRDQEVFDFTMVREYDDVVAEAKKNKRKYIWPESMAYVWKRITSCPRTILVESSREEAVLLGNQVKNQHWEQHSSKTWEIPPCFLRSLTMGRFLRMSSWTLRQAGRCDSGVHPGQIEGTFVLGGVTH